MITDYRLYDFGIDNQYLREMWIGSRLKEIPQGYSILDIESGEQIHKSFCSHLKYVSQDSGRYNNFEDRKVDIKSEVDKLPFDNESFDTVLCAEVLPHVYNPEEVIKEMARVIKPEGRLIATAPFCSITHLSPNYFQTGFSEYWYRKVLSLYNLKIELLQNYGDYFEYFAQELHRLYSVANKFCGEAALTNKTETDSINNVIRMLERYSINSDKKSSELLSYGYLVVAKKEK